MSVQDLIERCLQLYMNQKEVVETLLVQAKIEPGFTELVWQKLEEENREFFKAYHVRLMVKNQIMIFNKLLEKQVDLMRKISPAGVPLPVSNGSHTATCTDIEMAPSRLENLHHPMDTSALVNGRSSMHQSSQSVNDASVRDRSMDLSSNILLSESSDMGMLQAMNGMAIKSEPSYSSSPSFAYGAADGNILESRPTIGEASITPFNSTEPNSQTLNELPFDAHIGFLGQIPRNFSLSDLTADFCQSSDIMDNYSRSPFLDANDFPSSPGRTCQGVILKQYMAQAFFGINHWEGCEGSGNCILLTSEEIPILLAVMVH
ncbi:hypothetical protein ACLOJK_024694 [Asimina triloba]